MVGTNTPVKKKNLETIIELKNLVKVFGKETAVDDVNLRIKRGEFVTLLGPSGCGKTTILRMIAGFDNATSGTIYLEGNDVTAIPPHKRPVNTVFQKYALFPHLDVFNNIAFGLKIKILPKFSDDEIEKKLEKFDENKKDKRRNQLKKLKRLHTKAEIKERVERALKLVGLDEYGHRDVESLSGGQQQRVAIARALVMEPKVLLLDEPLGALDLKMRKEMQLELRRLHREVGITFIYVTHDQEEALAMSDTVVVISDGKIQQVGTPKDIYEHPSNAFVADFIGESNILGGTIALDGQVKFLGQTFATSTKGFAKNQPVDIVIRPEDITLHEKKTPKTTLSGKILSSTFMGTYYEVEVESNGYEFTVQTMELPKSENVFIELKPSDMHIMEMEATINEYKTYMTSDTTVEIAGENFLVTGEWQKGNPVTARVAFDHIELVDDEKDGIVGGSITNTIYKGTYYQVKVWTADDTPFIVNTPYEWDINDQVGIRIAPEHIVLEKREEIEEE